MLNFKKTTEEELEKEILKSTNKTRIKMINDLLESAKKISKTLENNQRIDFFQLENGKGLKLEIISF